MQNINFLGSGNYACSLRRIWKCIFMGKALVHWRTLLDSKCSWKYLLTIMECIEKEGRCQGSRKVKEPGRVRGVLMITLPEIQCIGNRELQFLILWSYLTLFPAIRKEQIFFLIAGNITHFIQIFRWLNKTMHIK